MDVEELIDELMELRAEVDELPPAVREKLLVLGCSFNDYVFWVRTGDSKQWLCTEIETGVTAVGNSPEAATKSYWEGE